MVDYPVCPECKQTLKGKVAIVTTEVSIIASECKYRRPQDLEIYFCQNCGNPLYLK